MENLGSSAPYSIVRLLMNENFQLFGVTRSLIAKFNSGKEYASAFVDECTYKTIIWTAQMA
jgi:hypothetical protein